MLAGFQFWFCSIRDFWVYYYYYYDYYYTSYSLKNKFGPKFNIAHFDHNFIWTTGISLYFLKGRRNVFEKKLWN